MMEDTWQNRAHPIHEDMRFQRIQWRFERCGWVTLSLLLAAAGAGAFANGPLSSGSAVGGPLTVTYERVARSGAPLRMQVDIGPGAPVTAKMRFSPSFMQTFTIEALYPRPVEEQFYGGGAELAFGTAPGQPRRIYIDLRSVRSGIVTTEIALAGAPPARLTHVVLP